MPTSKKRVLKPKVILSRGQVPEKNDLEEFVREASEVKVLTQQAGWAIIERDLNIYQTDLARKLAYLNPKRPEAYEARILFLAADKALALINDYQENRDMALELLAKLENPDLAITLDVDNEISKGLGESIDGH